MYCKIKDNEIIQCSIHPEIDFVWVENGVCGMIQNLDGTFSNPVLTKDQLLDIVRFQRNQLLQQSDWMANSDVTMTEEWRVYRQALRDLPNTQTPSLDENGQLTNITWPEKPQ